MNKTHGSRKRDIETYIMIEIMRDNIKRSIDVAEMHGVSPKRYGQLVKHVEEHFRHR